jgi:hypothetical protein
MPIKLSAFMLSKSHSFRGSIKPHLLIETGKNALMTVVGTALLDNLGLTHKQELCVQNKGKLVVDDAMDQIIKVNVILVLLSRRRLSNHLCYSLDSWNILVSK